MALLLFANPYRLAGGWRAVHSINSGHSRNGFIAMRGPTFWPRHRATTWGLSGISSRLIGVLRGKIPKAANDHPICLNPYIRALAGDPSCRGGRRPGSGRRGKSCAAAGLMSVLNLASGPNSWWAKRRTGCHLEQGPPRKLFRWRPNPNDVADEHSEAFRFREA